MKKDIFKEYKKANIIRNTWIVIFSLVLALSINFFVFDSEMWSKLKADVLWVWENMGKSNLYLEMEDGVVKVKNGKKMKELKNISFTLVYNPENVKIENTTPWISEAALKNVTGEDGLNMIMISLASPTDIEKFSEILTINLSKKQNKTEFINLINANFEDDSWELFLLSMSWINF